MTRRILIAVGAALGAAVAIGVIWFYTAGNVGDPTQVTAPPITAAPAAPSTTDPEAPATTAAEAASPTTGPVEPTSTSAAVEVEDQDAPEDSAAGGAEDASDRAAEPDPDSGDTVELQLTEGTEARFLIYEDLRGEPFTAVGVTTEVVGRIEVDRSDPGGSRMGDILINARTFATDSSNRDRAIRGPILGAEQFEFITFRPLQISGLSAEAAGGGEWSFTVAGELTVRDVTNPVTFEVTARWGDGDRLEGEAFATVFRSDYDLSVPSVPFVANVADEIGLELDFVARPVG